MESPGLAGLAADDGRARKRFVYEPLVLLRRKRLVCSSVCQGALARQPDEEMTITVYKIYIKYYNLLLE